MSFLSEIRPASLKSLTTKIDITKLHSVFQRIVFTTSHLTAMRFQILFANWLYLCKTGSCYMHRLWTGKWQRQGDCMQKHRHCYKCSKLCQESYSEEQQFWGHWWKIMWRVYTVVLRINQYRKKYPQTKVFGQQSPILFWALLKARDFARFKRQSLSEPWGDWSDNKKQELFISFV